MPKSHRHCLNRISIYTAMTSEHCITQKQKNWSFCFATWTRSLADIIILARCRRDGSRQYIWDNFIPEQCLQRISKSSSTLLGLHYVWFLTISRRHFFWQIDTNSVANYCNKEKHFGQRLFGPGSTSASYPVGADKLKIHCQRGPTKAVYRQTSGFPF